MTSATRVGRQARIVSILSSQSVHSQTELAAMLADEGLDVRVALPPNMSTQGFIPRPATGFQVKAKRMGPAKIRDEMRPKPIIFLAFVEQNLQGANAQSE